MAEAMTEEIGDDVYADIEINFIKATARTDD